MTASIPSFIVPAEPAPRRRGRTRIDLGAHGRAWRWPLALTVDDRDLLALAENANERRAVDLGYDPRPDDGDRLVPVFAAQSGRVGLAMEDDDPRNYFVVIEHGLHWATCYSHLSRLHVGANRGTRASEHCEHVRAGDVIGYAHTSPLHVRFELWHWRGHDFVPVDPLVQFDEWDAPALDVVHSVNEKRGA